MCLLKSFSEVGLRKMGRYFLWWFHFFFLVWVVLTYFQTIRFFQNITFYILTTTYVSFSPHLIYYLIKSKIHFSFKWPWAESSKLLIDFLSDIWYQHFLLKVWYNRNKIKQHWGVIHKIIHILLKKTDCSSFEKTFA